MEKPWFIAPFREAISACELPVMSRSSTYNTMIINEPLITFRYTFESDLHRTKFRDSKKLSILAYQALGACFSPYNDFLNLHTREWPVEKPWGFCIYIFSVRSPFRKAHFTSI